MFMSGSVRVLGVCLWAAVVAGGCDATDHPDDVADGAPVDVVDPADAADSPDAALADAASPDAGPPVCDQEFVACGGDVTGTWTMTDLCADLPPPTPTCEGQVEHRDLGAVGMYTFSDDASYAGQISLQLGEETFYPAACLPEGTTACAELDQPDNHIVCTGDVAVSCTCAGTDTSDPFIEEGHWSVEGTTITLAQGKDPGDPAEYCVDGDLLRIRPESMQAGFELVMQRATPAKP
jgi:hypothetical protein